MTVVSPPSVGAPTGAPVRRHPAGRRTHELRWRLILDDPREGAANMASDHALASCLGEGEGAVRLYGWSRPTVSFGKNEPAARIVAGGREGASQLAYVRRPTGGRAVLHDDEVTYAVVAPLDAFGGLRKAYRRIHEALAEALGSLGADVRVAGARVDGEATTGARVPSPRPDAGPCFQTPAPGEIVAGGRKLVGSAQARLEGALLQHGSILLGGGRGQPGSGSVTLAELVGALTWQDVAQSTAGALERSFGGSWREEDFDARELEAAERLEAERYGTDTWTWRR